MEYLELLVAKQDGRAGVRGNPNSGSIDAAPSSLLIKAEFNHLARECIDAEVTADFYCDILGFRRIPRPDFEDEEVRAWSEATARSNSDELETWLLTRERHRMASRSQGLGFTDTVSTST